MAPPEPIAFVQIAAAKDHIYGMTAAGTVWRYDVDLQVWEALSMAAPAPPKRHAFQLRTI